MSHFSEKLKDSILQCGVSVADIARQAGISAALLYKFQNGTRLPESAEALEAILESMLLPKTEYSDLLREYQIERLGVSKFFCFEDFKQMLSTLANIPALTAKRGAERQVDVPRIVSGGENLNAVVQYLLEQESIRTGGMIRMMIPLQYNFCFECLSVVLTDCNPEFDRAVHLFYFHPNATNDALYHNMRIIRNVLPRMMTLHHYEPRYVYQLEPDIGTAMYPYYLITSLGVLQISADYQSGVFLKNKEIILNYQRRFDEIARNHLPVMNSGEASLKTYFTRYYEMGSRHSKAGVRPVIMAPIPCVLPCLGPERALAYMPSDMAAEPEILQIADLYFSSSKAFGYDNFFSVEGLIYLLKTGTIMELQGPFVPKLRQEDAIFALEELLERAKNGNIRIHVFRTNVFHSLSPMSLSLYENQLLTFCDMPDRQSVFADVTEKTLSRVVRAYSESAEQLGDVYSHEESIAAVETILRRFHGGLL